MSIKKLLADWEFSIGELSYKSRVKIPHTWNVIEETQHHRGDGVYKTAFTLEAATGGKAYLHFAAAYHTARVTLNGKLIGTHTGSGYTPFEFDITENVNFGDENTLEVTVNNSPSENILPNMKNFDWADDGGLIRDVTVLIDDESALKEIRITPRLDEIAKGDCSGVLSLDAELFGGKADGAYYYEIKEYKTGNSALKGEISLKNGKGEIEFSRLKTWDFDAPNLYTLTLKGEGTELTRRFGLRKIAVEGGEIMLNNSPVYLTGCEWMPGSHPDYGMAEPLEHSILCLSQLKDSGCRFTRFHWQQDDTLYDWCDENGLLVQEEIPYWGHPKEVTESQLAIAKQQADEMVAAHYNHPSIVFWGVGNELGGQKAATIDYVDKMVKYIKTLDSTRCVNYVSNTLALTGDETDDATLHGDIAMWNEYLGFWQPCDDISYMISRAGEICGGKPLIITEFGLCEPHFKGGDSRRTEVLLEHTAVFDKVPAIKGYVWFSLNDYRTHVGEAGEGRLRQRVHGSTDLYGNKKPSYDVLCRVNGERLK